MKPRIKVLILMILALGGLVAGLDYLYTNNSETPFVTPIQRDWSEQTSTPTITPTVPEVYFPIEAEWYRLDRVQRAKVVYDTICISGGWWGEGCPSERDLVAWLVYEEGSTLAYNDRVNMARGIRYRFAKFGDTRHKFIYQLSAFTSFYNTDGDDNLDMDDWNALLRPPDMSEYVALVDFVYIKNLSELDGRFLYWWSETEVVIPKGRWPGEYYQTWEEGVGPFYFTGIPDVRTCAMENKNCKAARLLIASFDGLRPDAIAKAPMPNLLALMDKSAYTLTGAVTVSYPATLPSHAAMLSGLCTKENGIYLNRYFKYMGYSKGVDLFDLAHAAGMKTVMIVGKDKLRQLAEPETTDVFEVHYDEEAVGKEAVEQISQGFDLMFVHFPSADKIGHKYGWMGYSYMKMLRNGDDAFGKMILALQENGLLSTTLIIVTADHGGHDTGHPGTVIEDYRIPWIVYGPMVVPGELITDIQTMDTAATAAFALGLPLQPEWKGIPVYEAFRLPIIWHPESNQWPCHINYVEQR